MTTTLLQQALTALERLGELDGWATHPFVSEVGDDWIPAGEQARRALEAIRAHLAQPAPAVPLTDERAAFEAWADKTWGDRIVSRDYAWLGWKARAAHGIGGGGK